MYRYDEFDRALVESRVAEFTGQVERRLKGDLTEDQFKPLRLMNGLYLQLHAYMLRVAIPYGTLNSAQMKVLAGIARDYDRDYGHFTTRQNIQFNWLKLKDVPPILARLSAVEMHAMQTSGNCIRNITTDQFAGAAQDELEDPRPWCELLRQWSTLHPEFTYLPRKFKIAINAAKHDRAAIRLHDIGLQMVEQNGERGWEVYVGGGMGRTPHVGPLIGKFVRQHELLGYLEACLRVYNRGGRRDNLYKSRIKILVASLGEEEYRRQVEEEFAQIDQSIFDYSRTELKRISAAFAPPVLPERAAVSDVTEQLKAQDKAFARWVRRNVSPHKLPGYAIVNISLKPYGEAPGDITSAQMDLVADLSAKYSADELRATHEQNLVLPYVAQDDLPAVWKALDGAGLATPNINLITDIIACPGLDYCSLANARSITVSNAISKRLSDYDQQSEIGELKIKISGCINACGHHHAGHIGILGVDKKGEEFYQITLGGSAAEDASIGSIAGKGLAANEVPDAIARVVDKYLQVRNPGERFLDSLRRLGADPFKEALYAPH
jgi:sulfite reductase (NADPH) hemoprotein beta-component